ncbi:FbpB family small basic protein [Camelliibacillus cellulosilyticus]|uniref:FbpB family small basic protein n=1 Tax=Camelliibacillus cellulosilyticus TaxID=2174486 RepID=A0ABV9GJT5_9BACL
MRKRLSIKELVSKNKSEILKDNMALEKIESKIEQKHSSKS